MAGEERVNDITQSFAAPEPDPAEDRRTLIAERRKEFWMTRFRRGHSEMDRPGETSARPPEQPPDGPGGKAYTHLRVVAKLHGSDETAYWIFEPAAPSPRTAPVVVFLHGWGGTDPMMYGGWIDHLVMRGNIVLFPVYQTSIQSDTDTVLQYTVQAVRDALQHLNAVEHLQGDWDRLGVVGHSAGGLLAVQVAALAASLKLPQPKAVMAVHPSRGREVRHPIPRVDLRSMLPSTLMLVVVGRDDQAAGDREARLIYLQTSQLPPSNKNFITVVSDFHGTPPLVSNHVAPVAPRRAYQGLHTQQESSKRSLIDLIRLKGKRTDALNYYGYWKLWDALTDAAFYGTNREYVLGNTPQQRFMGTWSDGIAVTELVIGESYSTERPERTN